MIFRLLALGLSVGGPLWYYDQPAQYLRGSSISQPQQDVVPEAGVAGKSDGDDTKHGEYVPVEGNWSSAAPPTTSTTHSTTACPACNCEPVPRPVGEAPVELGFASRVVYRAALADDIEFEQVVLGFVVLYGIAAGTCGWAIRGCCTSSATCC